MMSKTEIARLVKETVAACKTPEELDNFLAASTQATMAEFLVDNMTAPGQRATWVRAMREKYPADFAAHGEA